MRLIGKLLALPLCWLRGFFIWYVNFGGPFRCGTWDSFRDHLLAALVLFFVAGFLPGLAWLMIAFLISPYGLPLAAACW